MFNEFFDKYPPYDERKTSDERINSCKNAVLSSIEKTAARENEDAEFIIAPAPREYRHERTSPLKFIIPALATAAAVAITIPLVLNKKEMSAAGDKSAVSSIASDSSEEKLPEVITIPNDSLAFSAEYVRTDGYVEGENYPKSFWITSKKELDDYYEENKDKYDLDHDRGRIAEYQYKSFIKTAEKYDDEFFKEHNIMLVLLEEGSGSITHTVKSVNKRLSSLNRTTYFIVPEILRTIPYICTDDMAEWHIFIAVEKQYGPESCDIELSIREKQDIPSISAVAEMTNEEALEALCDFTYNELRESWGNPDGEFSGMSGGVWSEPSMRKSVAVYYDYRDGYITKVIIDDAEPLLDPKEAQFQNDISEFISGCKTIEELSDISRLKEYDPDGRVNSITVTENGNRITSGNIRGKIERTVNVIYDGSKGFGKHLDAVAAASEYAVTEADANYLKSAYPVEAAFNMPEFPDTEFKCTKNKLYAENTMQLSIRDNINCVFLTDLNGDEKREICVLTDGTEYNNFYVCDVAKKSIYRYFPDGKNSRYEIYPVGDDMELYIKDVISGVTKKVESPDNENPDYSYLPIDFVPNDRPIDLATDENNFALRSDSLQKIAQSCATTVELRAAFAEFDTQKHIDEVLICFNKDENDRDYVNINDVDAPILVGSNIIINYDKGSNMKFTILPLVRD